MARRDRPDVTPDPVETARRVGAAIAYAEFGKPNGQVKRDLCALLGISVRTLDRILGKGEHVPRGADWDELRVIADYCGLPPEWFTADLGRLHLAVPSPPPAVTARRRRRTVERRLERTLEQP